MENNIGHLIMSNPAQDQSSQNEVPRTVGRPREFSNAAEKQKAYRDRKKQTENHNLVADQMMQWFQEREAALRNWIAHWTGKGKTVEITSAGLSNDFGKALVSGYSSFHIEAAVFKYLLLTGALVKGQRRGWDQLYDLSPATSPANAGTKE